ncbi:MAG: nucleoside-diphosphate kinase [Candidatus Margulisiibacteriota bacterium]
MALNSKEERTLVLIKPDAIERGLIGEVISRFEKKGLAIIALEMMQMTPEIADMHYKEHLNKPFYPALKEFMTSGPIIAMILEGRDVIHIVRKMAGATDAATAEPGSIRGDFSTSNKQNIVHASDSSESATREITLFFGV